MISDICPRVSVIVANYNKAAFIRACLDSILSQTYKDLEIVICDDASTDGSVGIIQDYARTHGERIKSLFLTANRGVAYARHQAICAAGGEYITTLDSDDFFLDTRKIEREMTLVMGFRDKHGQDILAFSPVSMVDKNGADTGLMARGLPVREGRILEGILGRSCLIPRDFILKKSAYFDVGGYDFSLKTHEDWDLKIRLAGEYEFYCTDSPGVAYRKAPGGLSSFHFQTARNLWQVFLRHIERLPRADRWPVAADFFTFLGRRRRYLKNEHRQKVCQRLANALMGGLGRMRFKLLMLRGSR